jgi:hypothetical protein
MDSTLPHLERLRGTVNGRLMDARLLFRKARKFRYQTPDLKVASRPAYLISPT